MVSCRVFFFPTGKFFSVSTTSRFWWEIWRNLVGNCAGKKTLIWWENYLLSSPNFPLNHKNRIITRKQFFFWWEILVGNFEKALGGKNNFFSTTSKNWWEMVGKRFFWWEKVVVPRGYIQNFPPIFPPFPSGKKKTLLKSESP